MEKYISYVKNVIKRYEVDLSSLKQIDNDNLFLAINTVISNIGEIQFAEKLKKKIEGGADIYEISSTINDLLKQK